MFVLFWGRVRDRLAGGFWNSFAMVLGMCWELFGVVGGSSGDHGGIIRASFCHCVGIV